MLNFRSYSKPLRTKEMTPRAALRTAQNALRGMKAGESKVLKGVSVNGHQVVASKAYQGGIEHRGDAIRYARKRSNGKLVGAILERNAITGAVEDRTGLADRKRVPSKSKLSISRSSESAGSATVRSLNAKSAGAKKGSSGHSGG